ncbi:MAG: hypothetical protein ACI3U8_06930 [Candidatus Onthomonas sp.]
MKVTRKLLTLLLSLALCLGMLTGCASDNTVQTDGEGENQQTEQGQPAEEAEQEQLAEETEMPPDDAEIPFTDFEIYTVKDLELTAVDDTISTMEYVSCNGKTMIVPVLQNANWDNTVVAEDKTFVEITNTTGEEMSSLDGCYYCTYFSEEQPYYDLDDMAQQYSDVFEDAEIYPKTESKDGSVQGIAVHGFYQGHEIYQYMITIDYEDEYAVMDLSFYTSDLSAAEPLLDYWGLPNPAAG